MNRKTPYIDILIFVVATYAAANFVETRSKKQKQEPQILRDKDFKIDAIETDCEVIQ